MIPRLLALLCFRLCVGQRDAPGDGSLPKPTLSAWPSSVVPAKSNVTLRCSSPVPGIRFILRKGPDILDSRLPLDPTKTTAEFLLTELGPRSAGPYTCECFWRGLSGVTSQLSHVLLLLVTGYLPKPSLQAHHVGQVTAGGQVALQCQIPSTMVQPLESALLKAGTPSPVQLHSPVGSESDFSLQGVTVSDSGTYSCIYYQARAPFWASDPSPALDILVTVPPRASSEGYTKGNLVRLGVAAGVLLMGVVLVLEAWHARGVPHAGPGSPQIPSAPMNPGQVGSADAGSLVLKMSCGYVTMGGG
ncbi:T-cell-interacting, activating receptor on myeloid cells protein 1 [Callospermophilus lateralis]|uniref:T-cell-interacting, activating receptor on myeloid cells protein 1 n=1 Tax=Callospermophilus lateralis TaxID=76772 RepID=UPI00405390E2